MGSLLVVRGAMDGAVHGADAPEPCSGQESCDIHGLFPSRKRKGGFELPARENGARKKERSSGLGLAISLGSLALSVIPLPGTSGCGADPTDDELSSAGRDTTNHGQHAEDRHLCEIHPWF
jgi:hypothetical protein